MKTEQIEQLKLIFPNFDFVIGAYLFGSRAKMINRFDSDLDIAILVKDDFLKSTTFIQELARLECEIQKVMKEANIDLIVLNEQNVIFCHNVLTKGITLYQTNSKQRIFFQMSVIKRYCDFKPTLQLIEKFHIKGIKYRLGIV